MLRYCMGTEFVKDSNAVRLRCGFDDANQHELEKGLVVVDVEAQPLVSGADHVDEQPRCRSLHAAT